MSDEELLTSLMSSKKIVYFDELYERYIPLVYGVCLKYLQNTTESQDAVIDIYEYLSTRVASYQISNFRNRMYTVIKNHCFAVLREKKKEIVVDFDSNILESDEMITLLSEESGDEREAILKDCIEELPEPQRISILHFFFDNQSYQDIVELTQYNMKSVKSYIQNGKRNLKNCIEKKVKL